MEKVVCITLKDGLLLPSGYMAPASYACVIFCRVPADWVEGDTLKGDTLKAEKLERVFENLYGQTWRAGKEDGSQYVVRSVESRVLTPAEEQSAPWQSAKNNAEFHYWFYRVSATGEFQAVEPVGQLH